MLVCTFKGACVPLPQGTAVQRANGDDGAIWRSGELFIATGAVMRQRSLRLLVTYYHTTVGNEEPRGSVACQHV